MSSGLLAVFIIIQQLRRRGFFKCFFLFAVGALKCEAKKFRPREVVKNVLQMAHASVKSKNVAVEARINDDVPLEVGIIKLPLKFFIPKTSNSQYNNINVVKKP